MHDLLGLFDKFTPKFVKQYAHLFADMEKAFAEYREDVEQRRFPTCEHCFAIEDAEWEACGSGEGGRKRATGGQGEPDEEPAWAGQLVGC